MNESKHEPGHCSPELLPCPFCGSKNIDPEGWASTDCAGPACDDCAGTADTVALWNSRPDVAPALVAAIIERCAKIADPWPGYWIDHSSTDADCAVVAVRTEIAAKIRRYSMTNIINLQFPKCCECGVRATQHIDLVDESGAPAGQKHFCADHGNVLSEIDLCLLIDKKNEEIAQLRQELASLREAHRSTLSRPVSSPAEKTDGGQS